METFQLDGHSHIQLNQLLKMLGWAETGGEANSLIVDGEVVVNGIVETQKRKKLIIGDKVDFAGKTVEIVT